MSDITQYVMLAGFLIVPPVISLPLSFYAARGIDAMYAYSIRRSIQGDRPPLQDGQLAFHFMGDSPFNEAYLRKVR